MAIKVLEFYSGIGGMHYALNAAGLDATVARAFEINNFANDVYAHNFGKRCISQNNIEAVPVETFDKYLADLWTMSPPCQPFTQQRSSKQGGADDPRCRSFLYILDALSRVQHPPSYILLENVRGFETSSAREMLVERLAELQYTYQEFLLSPTQLGIPNSRMRYYMLATRMPAGLPYKQSGTILNEIPGYDHSVAIRPLSDFLQPAAEIDATYCIKDKTLWKHAPLFDIVLPTMTNTCCFTKNYFHFVEGTGSILQTETGLNTRQVWDAFLAKRAAMFPDLPREYALPASLANDNASCEDTLSAIEKVDNPLDALRLRYFTPREVANLMCFPGPEAFSFPEHITRKQRYRLLGNNIEYPLTEEQRATYIDKKSGKRVSAYRFRVYDALLKVPAGKVTSYKLLADSIGSSPRAVGQALRHNPFAPYIPCTFIPDRTKLGV
ncbi:hypothetical protein RI367_008258 [Sorochytrium milnesiophthora]